MERARISRLPGECWTGAMRGALYLGKLAAAADVDVATGGVARWWWWTWTVPALVREVAAAERRFSLFSAGECGGGGGNGRDPGRRRTAGGVC
jgi:hypothetical protein